MKAFAPLLFVLLLISACQTSEKKNVHLAEVERLQLQVDSAEKVFLSWNLDSLAKANKAIQQRLDNAVALLVERDVMLNMEQSNLMADFKSSGKAFKKMGIKVSRIMEEIGYSRKQLADLKNDLSRGDMEDNKVNEYVGQEAKAVHTLLGTVREMDAAFIASRERVNLLGPQVDSLLASIQAEQ